MHLLLTGASGFIGRNVLLRAPRTWRITAVYHASRDLGAFIAAHELGHVTAVRCDLTNADDVGALSKGVGQADAALYLAANGDPAVSADRPRWDLESNTVALVNLLEHGRLGHVVFVSSGAVYDGLVGAVSPATAVSPRLPYAISKLASEHYLRFFTERRRTVASAVAVRFFGAYGPYEAPRKITTRWMRAILDGRRDFTIRGNGENLIDFMYVDDAVDGLLRLVTASDFSGTVDFASGSPVTVNDVIKTLAGVMGVDASVVHEGRTEEYITFHTIDPTMRDRFGFVPRVPLDDGIRRLHEFLLQDGHASRQPA